MAGLSDLSRNARLLLGQMQRCWTMDAGSQMQLFGNTIFHNVFVLFSWNDNEALLYTIYAMYYGQSTAESFVYH